MSHPQPRFDLIFALQIMATLDLGAKPCPEPRFALELDPVLRGKRARQGWVRNEPELDDGLTETPSGRGLRLERTLELTLAEETLLDEQAAKGSPRDTGRFHQ